MRRALGLTQEEFAARYHIPLGTLREERRLPQNAAHIERELGIRIVTPITHWEMLRPWAALWT